MGKIKSNKKNIQTIQNKSSKKGVEKNNKIFSSSKSGELLLLILIVAIAYIPALFGGFVWDDDNAITNNPLLRIDNGLEKIWFQPSLIPFESHYWPLVYTIFRVEYHLWGYNPFGYHLVNIILHICNTLLLWFILRRLLISGAFLAAAIFGLHPVHVESVAWAVELKDVLSGLFYLLTFLMYIHYLKNKKTILYIAAIIFFICGMLSKSIVVTLPIALLLFLWWQKDKLEKRDILSLIPFFIVAIIMAIGDMLFVQQHKDIVFGLKSTDKILIAGHSIWFYIRELLYPYPLVAMYNRWAINTQSIFSYCYPIALVVLMITLWIKRKQWGKGTLTALLFFIITLSPILGFVKYTFMQYSFVADRFQYLASIGLIVLFSVFVTNLFSKLRKEDQWIKYTAIIVLLSVYGILTFHQGGFYKDRETLFRYNVEKVPDSPGANSNLGYALDTKGNYKEAIAYFKKSIQLDPHYALPYNNLAVVLTKLNQNKEAIENLAKALQLQPDLSSGYVNMGIALCKENRTDEALRYFAKAINLKPEDASVHLNYGTALLQKSKYDEALPHFNKVLETEPNNADVHNNLGFIYLRKGDNDKAAAEFEKTLQIQPSYLDALNNYGYVLYLKKDYENAIQIFKKALQLKSNNPATYFNLANSLGAMDKNDEAVTYYLEAIKAFPNYADAYKQIAITYDKMKNPEKALYYYQKNFQILQSVDNAKKLAWFLATCRDAKYRNGAQALNIALTLYSKADKEDPETLDILAAAYAETGDFENAVKSAQEALAFAKKKRQEKIIEQIEQHLKFYQLKKPVYQN